MVNNIKPKKKKNVVWWSFKYKQFIWSAKWIEYHIGVVAGRIQRMRGGCKSIKMKGIKWESQDHHFLDTSVYISHVYI